MFEFCELKEKQFQEFVDTCDNKHFMQTKYMNDYYKLKNRESFFVGVKVENKIVAAALVYLESRFKGYKRYDIYKGFVMDYSNKKLLKFFTEEISKYLKGKNAYMFTIDPNMITIERDTNANIIKGGINNKNIIDELTHLGYKKSPTDMQVRWTYVLDINDMSSDEIFKTFKANTRNNISKTLNKYKINIKTLSYEELDQLKKITEDTSNRRGFHDKSLTYMQNIFKAFGDNITVKLAEMNLKNYLDNLNDEKEKIDSEIKVLEDNGLEGKSAKSKHNNLVNDCSNIKKRIYEAKKLIEKYGSIITLSAAMFITYGDEIIYFISGSYKEFMQFYGQYSLQWEMIKYACDNKYKRYNFYGLFDIFDKSGKDYGVYEFKKGFNGHVEELIGEYTYVINKKIFIIHKLLHKVKSIIKRGK